MTRHEENNCGKCTCGLDEGLYFSKSLLDHPNKEQGLTVCFVRNCLDARRHHFHPSRLCEQYVTHYCAPS